MLTFIGLAIIVTIVVLLLSEKLSPVIAMALIPFVGALIAGFDLETIKSFYLQGTNAIAQIAIMFIFAILFFGIMSDAGIFQPIVDKLIAWTRGNVVAVAVATVFISVVAQMDGAGATTFLLVVPALLPLYQRLKMDPYLLFLLLAASAGITNMLPWGGPLGRVATVLQMDVEVLYRPLIMVQAIGIGMTACLAVFLGVREKKRIIAQHGALVSGGADFVAQMQAGKTQRPKLFWVNAAIFFATMAVLFGGVLQPAFAFMIATSVALLVNYRAPKAQMDCIAKHAGGAITMATVILAAGLFLGTLKHSGMLDAISTDLIKVLPESVAPNLHYIIGFLGQPLELVFSTDAYYFGLFPIVNEITSAAGVDPAKAGYAVMIGSIVGTFVTPFSPALWMGLGLANLSMGKHIRYSFMWVWGLSLCLLLATWAIGVI